MIYELTLNQTYFGQKCVNRWYYTSTGTPAAVLGSFALASAFGVIPAGTPPAYPDLTPFRAIRDIQSQGVIYESLVCRALYDVVDFYERPFVTPVGGNQAGEAASPVLAMGFITSRTRQDIRAATKRMVGVTEGNMASGGTLISGFMPWMSNAAERMSISLTYTDEGNTLTFAPAVLGKQKYPTSEGRHAYRPWPTLAQQEANMSVGFLWTPYNTTRSQVSRQYNRGT